MTSQLAYCTTSQVAQKAAVDSSTVRRWVEKGLLRPAAVTPGGHYRFNDKDVENLLRPHTPTALADSEAN